MEEWAYISSLDFPIGLGLGLIEYYGMVVERIGVTPHWAFFPQ